MTKTWQKHRLQSYNSLVDAYYQGSK